MGDRLNFHEMWTQCTICGRAHGRVIDHGFEDLRPEWRGECEGYSKMSPEIMRMFPLCECRDCRPAPIPEFFSNPSLLCLLIEAHGGKELTLDA
jgi:hypothetical protein